MSDSSQCPAKSSRSPHASRRVCRLAVRRRGHPEMEKSDKIINIILVLVALGLLALCIASVVR